MLHVHTENKKKYKRRTQRVIQLWCICLVPICAYTCIATIHICDIGFIDFTIVNGVSHEICCCY